MRIGFKPLTSSNIQIVPGTPNFLAHHLENSNDVVCHDTSFVILHIYNILVHAVSLGAAHGVYKQNARVFLKSLEIE